MIYELKIQSLLSVILGLARASIGTYDFLDLNNAVARKSRHAGMLENQLFVGGSVNAVGLSVNDVAVQPLNFLPQVSKYAVGFPGN